MTTNEANYETNRLITALRSTQANLETRIDRCKKDIESLEEDRRNVMGAIDEIEAQQEREDEAFDLSDLRSKIEAAESEVATVRDNLESVANMADTIMDEARDLMREAQNCDLDEAGEEITRALDELTRLEEEAEKRLEKKLRAKIDAERAETERLALANNPVLADIIAESAKEATNEQPS